MLEISELHVLSHGKPVVQGVSLTIRPGEVTAILGANGAGKSELVLGIAGLLPIGAGTVRADGRDLTRRTPDHIRAAGVAAVPEGHQVLTQLSVDENLRAAGAQLSRVELADQTARIYGTFPELAERQGQLAGTMSGGQQQMLALGHALMARPRYILIDEMSLGLAPLIVRRLMGVVRDLAADGVGVLLVEQFVEVALELAQEVVVLRKGQVQLVSDAKSIKADRNILTKAYL